MASERYEESEAGVLAQIRRTQDACRAVKACPWWRPFRLSRLYREMIDERDEMRRLKAEHDRIFLEEVRGCR